MENDYIIKEIKKLKKVVQGIAYILKIETNMETNIDNKEHNIVLTEEQLASLTIMKYINEGNINQAENKLFEAIKINKSPEYLKLAMTFYEEINSWEEEKLNKCNFSKNEIVDGLNAVKSIYNIS